jgi:hypothetical protein
MPTARVIGRANSKTLLIAEYLRANGFSVETGDPKELHILPTDIEVHVDDDGPLQASIDHASSWITAFMGGVRVSADEVRAQMDVMPTPVDFEAEAEPEPVYERGNLILDTLREWTSAVRQNAKPLTAKFARIGSEARGMVEQRRAEATARAAAEEERRRHIAAEAQARREREAAQASVMPAPAAGASARPAAKPARRPARTRTMDDYDEEEVVVRHFRRPKAKQDAVTASTRRSNGVIRISDMDD